MKTVDVTPAAVQAAAAVIPAEGPFFMVNLLRYKERAEYDDAANVSPCTGREAYYERYVPAFNRIATAAGIDGITVFWVGAVLAQVIAPPDEQWDDIAIVEYPSLGTFLDVTANPAYQAEAAPHRTAALDDSRLIATARMTLPG